MHQFLAPLSLSILLFMTVMHDANNVCVLNVHEASVKCYAAAPVLHDEQNHFRNKCSCQYQIFSLHCLLENRKLD